MDAKTTVRFMQRVDRGVDGRCWFWKGALLRNGYGMFRAEKLTTTASRWAYMIFRGPIPNGMQIDHICRVRHCVNPEHLRIVTQRENVLCGIGVTAILARATHCKRGHEYNLSNTRYRQDRGSVNRTRCCRACERLRDKKRVRVR